MFTPVQLYKEEINKKINRSTKEKDGDRVIDTIIHVDRTKENKTQKEIESEMRHINIMLGRKKV